MKSKKKDASGVAPLNNDPVDLCTDPLTNSKILTKHFQSVCGNEYISTMPRLSWCSYPTISHITIETSDVENLLGKRIPHKATCLDAILTDLLCELSAEIAHALSFVFHMSLDTGQIPDYFVGPMLIQSIKKVMNALWIYHSPVSITPICSKIMEH